MVELPVNSLANLVKNQVYRGLDQVDGCIYLQLQLANGGLEVFDKGGAEFVLCTLDDDDFLQGNGVAEGELGVEEFAVFGKIIV